MWVQADFKSFQTLPSEIVPMFLGAATGPLKDADAFAMQEALVSRWTSSKAAAEATGADPTMPSMRRAVMPILGECL